MSHRYISSPERRSSRPGQMLRLGDLREYRVRSSPPARKSAWPLAIFVGVGAVVLILMALELFLGGFTGLVDAALRPFWIAVLEVLVFLFGFGLAAWLVVWRWSR